MISQLRSSIPADALARPENSDQSVPIADSGIWSSVSSPSASAAPSAEAPRELAKRQAAAWQPLLDWARARYHAALTTTVGVMAIDQDSNALARLRKAVEAENDFTLAGLHIATAISGSLVVGLALMEKEIDAERAWQVSHIEEHWQLERWGEDEELSDRLAAMRQEFHEAENFIALARV